MTNQESDNVKNSLMAIKATQKQSCEEEDIAKAFQLGLALGFGEKPNKWIPCNERLPEDNTLVLVTVKVGNREPKVRSGYYYMNGHFHIDNGDSWESRDKELIAWMPLPEPYRGGCRMSREDAIKELKDLLPEEFLMDYAEAIEMGIEALKQDQCEDCISRSETYKKMLDLQCKKRQRYLDIDDVHNVIYKMPYVSPMPKMGKWERMSGLSEDMDDRYKCSKCGNVVHSTNRINLYTFHRWCGRCGSNNDIAKMQGVMNEYASHR